SPRPAKTYSGGMRRRLDLAASLLNRPQVLFLDEPTSGLDPRSRADLWALIEELVDEGATVLLTSQYLEEVDRLADRISVLDDGRVIAEGSSQELKQRVGGEFLDVRVADGARLQTAVSELAPLAASEPLVDRAEGLVSVPVTDATGLLAEAVRRLDAAGLTIRDLALRGPTLDDVFLTLTGRAAERQAAQPVAPGRRRGRQGPRRASRSAA
ncbi:MAG TPA: AAA family ATPase, partial [Egibacteraceae bacterium]|nr:AAA family ATPase [Egibacteraceae bacterium]